NMDVDPFVIDVHIQSGDVHAVVGQAVPEFEEHGFVGIPIDAGCRMPIVVANRDDAAVPGHRHGESARGLCSAEQRGGDGFCAVWSGVTGPEHGIGDLDDAGEHVWASSHDNHHD